MKFWLGITAIVIGILALVVAVGLGLAVELVFYFRHRK